MDRFECIVSAGNPEGAEVIPLPPNSGLAEDQESNPPTRIESKVFIVRRVRKRWSLGQKLQVCTMLAFVTSIMGAFVVFARYGFDLS